MSASISFSMSDIENVKFPVMIMMCGASGSGKTTTAHILISELKRPKPVPQSVIDSGRGIIIAGKRAADRSCIIVSADDYFLRLGEYKFDPTKLPDAHAECYRRANEAVKNRVEIVVIDNTNTKSADYQKYVDLAEKNRYTVAWVMAESPWANSAEGCYEKSTKAVPLYVIQRQLKEIAENQ